MSIGKSDPSKRVNAGRTDRAVSPVIGVILMVAITVILAAVIGVFVMGLGDEIGDTAPSATVDFEWDSTNADVIIIHESGNTLELGEFTLLVDGGDQTIELDDGQLSAGETEPVDATEPAEDVQLRHDPSGTIIGSADSDDL